MKKKSKLSFGKKRNFCFLPPLLPLSIYHFGIQYVAMVEGWWKEWKQNTAFQLKTRVRCLISVDEWSQSIQHGQGFAGFGI